MDLLSFRNALPDRLETARLILRAPDRREIAAMAELANNEKIHAMTTLPFPYGQADAIDFIDNFARSDGEHAYAILLPTGTFIGTIGLHLKKDMAPELGYWLGEPFWGKGYMTEAARALIERVMASGRCPALFARTRETNAASRAVLARIGFTHIETAIDPCGPHEGVAVATYRIGRMTEAAL